MYYVIFTHYLEFILSGFQFWSDKILVLHYWTKSAVLFSFSLAPYNLTTLVYLSLTPVFSCWVCKKRNMLPENSNKNCPEDVFLKISFSFISMNKVGVAGADWGPLILNMEWLWLLFVDSCLTSLFQKPAVKAPDCSVWWVFNNAD